MSRFVPLLVGVFLPLSSAGRVFAQQFAVQQPVIENFSVATTVSAPDRGSVLLGGVGSAASGRTVYGPFPFRSAWGVTQQSASASVHVYIHDFEAMDAALLAMPVARDQTRFDSSITRRLQERAGSGGQTAVPAIRSENAARDAERLAKQAETRGKLGVARLHWERAARHGSADARRRLGQIQAQPASR
jgi:hypothetical protein